MMRTEIQRYGLSIVGCDQLLVFVSATAPIRAQFGHIFETAEKEGWSVEFRPDGTVRFAVLQAAEGTPEVLKLNATAPVAATRSKI